MLLMRRHRLLLQLRRCDRRILRVIRTSIRRKDVVARAAAAVVDGQSLGVVVVVAAAGFYGASEDVCESRSLVFHVFAAAVGEEGD